MKQISIVIGLLAVILFACKKEDPIVIQQNNAVFLNGTIGLSSFGKLAEDTIGDVSNTVKSYKVKVRNIQVSRDAATWYTLKDSAVWLDLTNGGDSLKLNDTLPVGFYEFAFLTVDSTIIERQNCVQGIDSSYSALFTTLGVAQSYGQNFLAYNDTTSTKIDTVYSYLDSTTIVRYDTTAADTTPVFKADTTISKIDTTYSIDSTIASSTTPPTVKNSLATDNIYWLLGGIGFKVEKDKKLELVIAIHPVVANRDLQSAACGIIKQPYLFIGTPDEFTSVADSIKAK